MSEHGTKTTPGFLPADGEASWSLLPSKFGLLTIRGHSATRKHPYPQGDRSSMRKPKKDKHQH